MKKGCCIRSLKTDKSFIQQFFFYSHEQRAKRVDGVNLFKQVVVIQFIICLINLK